ncbi:MAG: type II toxin-antitoxin system MqsA family antitoxin [Pyrinomonadaceae bacterium MAG19_C2-C3]|nr:type II toxin-antitoxin system MqsA family antitoxin [Pyrinomonadaceae bacterium MAG19_C2-C3]
MQCLVCKNDKFKQGATSLNIERGAAILVITDIPARVCTNCGEPYIEADIARDVQSLADTKLHGVVTHSPPRGERTLLHASF